MRPTVPTVRRRPARRPLPINLGVNHPFRPHPLEVAQSQCYTCFGWRDDPRHWVRP